MKAGIFSAGKIAGTFLLAFILAGCRHPAASQPAPDAALKRMDAESAGGRRRHDGRRRKPTKIPARPRRRRHTGRRHT